MAIRRILTLALGFAFAILVLIQLVPYGRNHTNPPAGATVSWDSPRTEALARRACYDCHSNETRWPWYSGLAPASWRIQHHVDEGRGKLNLSDFQPGTKEVSEAAGEAAETVRKGEMPPADYALAHAPARLSSAERSELARGLARTFAAFGEAGEHGGREGSPAVTGSREEGERTERGEHAEADERSEHGEREEGGEGH